MQKFIILVLPQRSRLFAPSDNGLCPGCKGKRSFALIKSRRHQLWYRIERERLNLGRYPLFSEMRILFDKGKQVGPDPITHYVYLWRHGKIDIYIGKGGVNGRWAAHMRASADDPNDRNETKTRYFLAHLAEMTCYIIAEELSSPLMKSRFFSFASGLWRG